MIGLATFGAIRILGDPCRSPSAGADLSQCDLTGKDLAGTDLTGANLTGAVVRSADLSNTILKGADLSGSDLTGADLSGATMESARLTEAIIEDAKLAEADLRGADLTDAKLGSSDLARAQMTDADLTGADLSGANLGGATLTGATLARAKLNGADLTDADLTGADLTSSTMTGAALLRTQLQESIGLTDEMLADALGVPETELASEVRSRELRFDATTAVIAAVAPAATGTGVAGVHVYVDSPAFHPLVVLGAGGTPSTPDWAAGVQGQWMLQALRFTELVAVTEAGREVVEDCGMYVGSVTGAETGHLIRYRQTIGVRVYAAATGQLVAAEIFRGPDPRTCAAENETTGAVTNGIWGDPADYAATIPWLNGIVHPPV